MDSAEFLLCERSDPKNDWLRLQHFADAAKQARLFVEGRRSDETLNY